jgi:hypothetical protein
VVLWDEGGAAVYGFSDLSLVVFVRGMWRFENCCCL